MAPAPPLLRHASPDPAGWVKDAAREQRRGDLIAQHEREADNLIAAAKAGDGMPAVTLTLAMCQTLDTDHITGDMMDLFAAAAGHVTSLIPQSGDYTSGWQRLPATDPGTRELARDLHRALRPVLSWAHGKIASSYLTAASWAARDLRRAIGQAAAHPAIERIDAATWQARKLGGMNGEFDVWVCSPTAAFHLLHADRDRTLCGRKLTDGWDVYDHCQQTMIDCRSCQRRRAQGSPASRSRDQHLWHAYRVSSVCGHWAASRLSDLLYNDPALTWAELEQFAVEPACAGMGRELASLATEGTVRTWTSGERSQPLTEREISQALLAALTEPDPTAAFCAALAAA